MNLKEKIKNWFTGSKIKELEDKIATIQRNEIKNAFVEIVPTQKGSDYDIDKKLVSKVLYNVNTKNIDVILSNGNVLSGIVDKEIYDKVKDCNNELLILNLISKKEEIDNQQLEIDFEQEIQKIIEPIIDILSTNDNFEIIGNKIYLKGIKSIAIPSSIVAEFIRLQENLEAVKVDNTNLEKITLYEEEFNALLMFTFWLLLNPIESSRNDCLTFIKKNDIQLTSNGLLICYRNVVSKGSKNKELIKFISENYFKKKKQKKSTKNYSIYSRLGDLILCKNNKLPEENNPYWENVGNLHELYQNLHTLKENTYTDNHTRTKTIKIGSIYKEDEDKIDLDNTIECSSGLSASPFLL